VLPNLRKVFGAAKDGALYPFNPTMMYVFNPAATETDNMVVLGDICKFVVGVIMAQINRLDHSFLLQGF
jgi:hypothetical protein